MPDAKQNNQISAPLRESGHLSSERNEGVRRNWRWIMPGHSIWDQRFGQCDLLLSHIWISTRSSQSAVHRSCLKLRCLQSRSRQGSRKIGEHYAIDGWVIVSKYTCTVSCHCTSSLPLFSGCIRSSLVSRDDCFPFSADVVPQTWSSLTSVHCREINRFIIQTDLLLRRCQGV